MKTKLLIFILLLGVLQIGQGAPASQTATNNSKTTAPSKSTATVTKPIPPYYGAGLCDTPGYSCIKTQSGDTWKKLFPDDIQRHIVQEINRTDLYFPPGKLLAIPDNLAKITLLDVAPFPKKIKPMENKLIIVDQDRLAWAAYDRNGMLVNWGTISTGRDYCPDVHKACNTMTGEFYVFNKQGPKCKSGIFPVGEGGSIMPYCMFFYRGFALHGSNEVPGYRDSHGCVRMFIQDAKWLNENFAEMPNAKNSNLGTKVIIQNLTTKE